MEAVLAVLGKVYHPHVCGKAERDRDCALDEEHPPPTTEATMAIEVIKLKVHNGASGQWILRPTGEEANRSRRSLPVYQALMK
jgi:hypothetical protein